MSTYHSARYSRLAPAVAISLLLGACASAPRPVAVDRGVTLETVRDERHSQVRLYADAPALLAATRVRLPVVEVAEGAYATPIGPEQAALVANRAGRELCFALAQVFHIDDTAPGLAVRVTLTAIAPTSRGASGASAVIDAFIPGPFRLPAGFGGLAGSAMAYDADAVRLAYEWAEGAGLIKESARVSVIGDAYQLAGDFGKELAAVMTRDAAAANGRRAQLPPADRAIGRATCLARFGQASAAGRGASFLLPLSPESIDRGGTEPSEAAPDSLD